MSSDYSIEYVTTGNLGSAMVVRYKDKVIGAARHYEGDLDKMSRDAAKIIRKHKRAVRRLSGHTVDWGNS